jgi:hypothetical protein
MYQVNWDGFEAMVWTICWLDILILAQKVGVAELNFIHLTPPKWASSKTQTPLIAFQTIQNHALDVSRELGWF